MNDIPLEVMRQMLAGGVTPDRPGQTKTWTYSPPDEDDGGRLVPEAFLLEAFARQEDLVFRRFITPKSWEERLADEIRNRSPRSRWRRLRNRVKRGRGEVVERLTLARDALAGRHECERDDW